MTLAWTSETASWADREPVAPALGRWTGSLVIVALLHALGLVAVLSWHISTPPLELPPPTIMIDMPPMAVPLPVPVPPPVFPKAPEAEPELIKEPDPIVVPPKPEVVLRPKPKPKPVHKKVDQAPPVDLPPIAAPPRPPEPAVAAPPMPAPVAAPPSLAPSYEGLIMAQLMRHKKYPRTALVRGLQGTPTVRFTLGRDGSLRSFALERSCGHGILDEEAVATIQRAAPLPPFPAEMTQAEHTFTVPIRFELR